MFEVLNFAAIIGEEKKEKEIKKFKNSEKKSKKQFVSISPNSSSGKKRIIVSPY